MRAQRKSSHQLHQHPAKKKMATKSKCSIFHIIAYGRVDKLCHPTSFVVFCCHGQNGVWVTHPNFLPLSHSTYVGRDMTFQRSAASQWSVCVPQLVEPLHSLVISTPSYWESVRRSPNASSPKLTGSGARGSTADIGLLRAICNSSSSLVRATDGMNHGVNWSWRMLLDACWAERCLWEPWAPVVAVFSTI